jgi:hypothetical protein
MLNELRSEINGGREVVLKVKVKPGSPVNRIRGEQGKVLKIDIKARPEKGKANKELVRFLAQQFRVDKNNVKILGGKTGSFKTVRVSP